MRNQFIIRIDSETNVKQPGLLHLLIESILRNGPFNTGALKGLRSSEKGLFKASAGLIVHHFNSNLFCTQISQVKNYFSRIGFPTGALDLRAFNQGL